MRSGNCGPGAVPLRMIAAWNSDIRIRIWRKAPPMSESMTLSEISPDTMLPDLLARHPEVRPVFDRYGLQGCGGPHGPHESLRFFSRTHGVEETRLLDELRAAIASAAAGIPTAGAAVASVADTIYRRFFLAGIVTILTAGATWGAWLLWSIGFAADFTGISVHHINAHGHAQIFGWVGLFIMGFASQAFPRLWHTTRRAASVCPISS